MKRVSRNTVYHIGSGEKWSRVTSAEDRRAYRMASARRAVAKRLGCRLEDVRL